MPQPVAVPQKTAALTTALWRKQEFSNGWLPSTISVPNAERTFFIRHALRAGVTIEEFLWS